jgi:hypothetical protein
MDVSSQLHAPTALPPGKEPCYPLDRRLGGPESRSGRCDEGSNICKIQSVANRLVNEATTSAVQYGGPAS